MRRQSIIVLILGAVLVVLPFIISGYWISLLTQALIFGGFAMGLDLLVGYTRMQSLGHAAFFGLAGYGAALAVTRQGINPWLAAGMGVGLSLVIAVLFAPLAVRFRGLTFLTVTLAFGQVAWGLATRWTSFTGGENGIPGIQRPAFFWDLEGVIGFYLLTVLVVTVVTFVLIRFAFSPAGMSLKGVGGSDTRMTALGYDVQARRALAFVVAALVGAIYGTLSAYFNKFIGPGSLDWRLSAQMLLSVIVGGSGSLWGPFIAGAGLHILKTSLVGETQRWPMVLGFLYILTVVFLPGGLASIPPRLRRLATRRQPHVSEDGEQSYQ
jgi:branched-chain amino acid transport system permease protein